MSLPPPAPQNPLKSFAALNVALWKFASVKVWPLAPRYRPVNGLRQLAVQQQLVQQEAERLDRLNLGCEQGTRTRN